MGTIRYELGADGIATITHDAPGAPVNTMTVQWQADLAAVVERVEADKERIKGVLVTSAKKTFFAGAQLDSVLTMTEADAPAAFAAIEAMKRSFRRLETLGRPVVALLNGAALGGGWELALAAHARFALDERGDRTVRFGTPEVSLGLIPGATGITKTVRLLGLMAAQPLLMEGKLFGPREALELGLVDGIGSTMDDLREMALAWIAEHPQAQQPWDRKDYRMPGGTPASPKIAMGHSFGAVIITSWLRKYGSDPTAPSPAELSFITLASPENRSSAYAYSGRSAMFDYRVQDGLGIPADTRYRVVDTCRKWDGWCDWHPDNISTSQWGMFWLHTDYTNLNLNDPANDVVVKGNVTYVLLPTPGWP